jgi:sulfate adenylyltransferase large subunit
MSELVRFSTAGSVDDGKSTMIGRLLYDTKSLFDDNLEAVERSSQRLGLSETNLALVTDGLRAEREQGITIDVAYRYFATPKRKFIIADTPGHVQYTRNMVTGASTADVAVILVDARKGLVEQSRRHAFIATLLRIPHLVVAINKMDLVDWSETRFNDIKAEFEAFATRLDIADLSFIPMSALRGDNVVDRSLSMTWYTGPTLLGHLETSTSRPTATWSTAGSPSSTSSVRDRTSITTTAGTPVRSPVACGSPATRSWCSRRAWRPPSPRSRDRGATSTRRSPRCRSSCA